MHRLAYSVDETAELLSLGRTSVYELIRQNALETRKKGRRRLVVAASVEKWLFAKNESEAEQ